MNRINKTVVFLALATSLSLPALATPVKPAAQQVVRAATYPVATPTTVAIWLFGSA